MADRVRVDESVVGGRGANTTGGEVGLMPGIQGVADVEPPALAAGSPPKPDRDAVDGDDRSLGEASIERITDHGVNHRTKL